MLNETYANLYVQDLGAFLYIRRVNNSKNSCVEFFAMSNGRREEKPTKVIKITKFFHWKND